MTERYAFKMYLNPGRADEYRRRHDALWPELASLLSEAGIANYSIHLDGETSILFAYLERGADHRMPALATLYLALMSDLMLTRLGVETGDLIVEGSLAANPAYCALLAAFRPTQPVFAGSDAAGTARGAALLAQWPPRDLAPPGLVSAPPSTLEGLRGYREAWRAAVLGG